MNPKLIPSAPSSTGFGTETDSVLLEKFVRHRSQAAFSELVDRHIGLVYSIALRRVNGDPHLAADVTQLVFVDLARRANHLTHHGVLSGWLFTATRFVAAKTVRGEQRRRAREGESQLMQTIAENENNSLDWDRVRPLLDEALADLKESDRVAVLLRFFENRSYAEIAARLTLSENAARMRVERGLDKLCALLTRRGASSTAAVLGIILTNQAVTATPAALSTSVTSAALAVTAATTGGTGSAALFMTIKTYSTGLAVLCAFGATVAFTVQARTNAGLRRELLIAAPTTDSIAALRAENLRLAKTEVEVETLRQDDAELSRLRVEAAELKSQLLRQERQVAERNARVSHADAQVVDAANVDQVPVATQRKAPQYPPDLRQAGIGGTVLVGFIVGKDGSVQNAAVITSTNAGFDTVAIAAVTAWKFAPGLKGGRVVNTHMQLPIVFKLGTNPTPLPEPVPFAAPSK